jgi:hypothetical protein
MHYLRRILALHTISINYRCSTAISLGHYITRCSPPRLITPLSSSNSISMLRSKFRCVLFILQHTLGSRQRQELKMIPLHFTFYLKAVHKRSFHAFSSSVFINHPTIGCHINWDIYKVVTRTEKIDKLSFNWLNQQDAATSQVYYLSFKYSSTCFGHIHAHHQELRQLQWICPKHVELYLNDK